MSRLLVLYISTGLTPLVYPQDAPCLKSLSVDITDGVVSDDGVITKDDVSYDSGNYYTKDGTIRGCVCNLKNCLPRCCPQDHMVFNKSCTIRPDSNFDVAIFDGTTAVNDTSVGDFTVVNSRCDKGYVLTRAEPDELFYLQRNGTLYVVFDESSSDNYLPGYYCLSPGVGNDSVMAFLCDYYDETVAYSDAKMLVKGMIISMPFLLITFLVYAILPDSNIHRKALMFYVLTLLLSYIFLVIIQLYIGEIAPGFCHVLGYGVIFFFVASFFWMNVMCIDMWLAFSGIRGFAGQRNAEKKRFLLYCLYACGMPTLHVLLVLMLNHLGDETKTYYPGIGKKKCFLEDGIPSLLYFYGPMAVLIAVNVVLFVLTAVKIQKVKKETSMLKHSDNKRHSYEDDKQKFNLYLKLMFAMGVNWSMEVISWAFIWKMGTQVPTYIWYLTDFCNALYGVFIFFIFVFKKKIWRNLKKRYYLFAGKPHLAHSLTTTQTTRSISTADTMVNNDHRLSEFKNGREERPLTQN